jgi:hypothetical protein
MTVSAFLILHVVSSFLPFIFSSFLFSHFAFLFSFSFPFPFPFLFLFLSFFLFFLSL